LALWGSHEFLVGATRRPRRPRRPGPFARVAGHPLAPVWPPWKAVCAIAAPKALVWGSVAPFCPFGETLFFSSLHAAPPPARMARFLQTRRRASVLAGGAFRGGRLRDPRPPSVQKWRFGGPWFGAVGEPRIFSWRHAAPPPAPPGAVRPRRGASVGTGGAFRGRRPRDRGPKGLVWGLLWREGTFEKPDCRSEKLKHRRSPHPR